MPSSQDQPVEPHFSASSPPSSCLRRARRFEAERLLGPVLPWVLAVLFLSAPWVVVASGCFSTDGFVLAYDLAAESTALAFCLSTWPRRLRGRPFDISAACLVGAMGSILVADFLYVLALGRSLPSSVNLLAESMYTAFYLLLGALLTRIVWRQANRWLTYGLALVFAGLSLALQAHFVLAPLEASVPPFALGLRVNYHIYSLASAAVFGLALVTSLRARAWPFFLFLSAQIVCHLSDFMSRHHLAIHHYASSSEATAGWTSGVGLTMLAVVGARRHGLLGASHLAGLNSLRALGSVFVFCSNVALIALFVSTSLVQVRTVDRLSLAFAIGFCLWALANIAAMALSRQVLEMVAATPSVATPEKGQTHARWVELPTISTAMLFEEHRLFAARYNDLARSANLLFTEQTAAAKERAIAKVARQFSHDVSSPLAALEVLLGEMHGVKDSVRVLTRNAVSRVRDISSALVIAVAPPRSAVRSRLGTAGQKRETLVASTLEALVSEKRIEYKRDHRVDISMVVRPGADLDFSRVDSAALKRAVSNLVNNSVEAIVRVDRGRGLVEICQSRHEGRIRIEVRDDGGGMLADVAGDLAHSEAGGLGLAQVRDFAADADGSLRLDRLPGRGTTATLDLPRCEAPTWYACSLSLAGIDRVVVVDDDATTPELWRDRFSRAPWAGRRPPDIVHVRCVDQLLARRQSVGGAAEHFLVDFDLQHPLDGIDLVGDLSLLPHATLVTSWYQEEEVLDRCRRLGLRLLPKTAIRAVDLVS